MNPPAPDQLKSEIQTMLERALESDDVTEVDSLLQTIQTHTNALRKSYGLPSKLDDVRPISVLKTPSEQLVLVGVGTETVMGHAVFRRAIAKRDPKEPSLFEQFFADVEKADTYRTAALKLLERSAKLTHAMVYPPLLLRATKNSQILLHVNAKGEASRPSATRPANLLMAMFEDGPIVPVLEREGHPRFERFVQTMYSLQGISDRATLEVNLISA